MRRELNSGEEELAETEPFEEFIDKPGRHSQPSGFFY